MALPLIVKICIITGSIVVGLASTLIFKLKKDNPIEEVAEEIIKDETGADIDLSPSTPEKKDE